jgi:hypothetical protein
MLLHTSDGLASLITIECLILNEIGKISEKDLERIKWPDIEGRLILKDFDLNIVFMLLSII